MASRGHGGRRRRDRTTRDRREWDETLTRLLVILTVVEIVATVVVIATYVLVITRRLAFLSSTLGKVAFGVRAVETQTGTIGPSVLRMNESLAQIDAALAGPATRGAGRQGAGPGGTG